MVRNHLLHNIGNLTLLTAKLNPSLSNSAFSVKRPEITQSLLALNAHFQAPCFSGPEASWDEKCIQARAQALSPLRQRAGFTAPGRQRRGTDCEGVGP